jgi:hypothetical protein
MKGKFQRTQKERAWKKIRPPRWEYGELIAKVKFWFGKNENIFNPKYVVEFNDEYAYIFKKKKLKEVV